MKTKANNTQVAYTADNYHLSTYSRQKGWNSWSYYSTVMQIVVLITSVNLIHLFQRMVETRRNWFTIPSVSVGYGTMYSMVVPMFEASGYFLGLNWADMFQPDDRIGIAYGQPIKATEAVSGATLSEVDPILWELYYSFRPNDSIEVTPAIFGGNNVKSDNEDDLFGAVLTTTFKF